MKVLNFPLSFIILFVIASCATTLSPQSQSEYLKGSNMAREFAKKDAMTYNCFDYSIMGGFFWFPRRVNADRQARKYTEFLQKQGKSEHFIKGFCFEYKRSYMEFLDLYCGE